MSMTESFRQAVLPGPGWRVAWACGAMLRAPRADSGTVYSLWGSCSNKWHCFEELSTFQVVSTARV